MNHPRRIYAPSWLLLATVLAGLCLFLNYSDTLWRWDQLLYDSQMRVLSRPAPEDIVIIAVDNASLAQVGRWPWPRRVHGDLVKRLTMAGAKAIFLDIIFTEPDRRDPEGDQLLADAITQSQRVFLPVIIEQFTHGGELSETLPMPLLLDSAIGVGHVDIDLDRDGMARRVFLKEGVGTPRWSSVGAVLLNYLQPGYADVLPGGRNPTPPPNGSLSIVRDHHILLPFAGPPGHFSRFSYIDILNDRVPNESLQGKIVLVGATATGLGDFLPTPVSGHSQPMPGVEVNANLIDALRRGITIESLGLVGRLLLSTILLMPALLLLPLVKPSYGMLFVGGSFLFTLAFCAFLLHGLHLWFPPTSVLIGLTLGYPLWSWRRLTHTVQYFEQELARLDAEPRAISFLGESPDIVPGLQFLQKTIPLQGWCVRSNTGQVLSQSGELPSVSPPSIELFKLCRGEGVAWIKVPRKNEVWDIGLVSEASISETGEALICEYLQSFSQTSEPASWGAYERVDFQIQQVQEATADMTAMRRLFTDTLTQMADGLLLINSGGLVVMANTQASQLLKGSIEGQLAGLDVESVGAMLNVPNGVDWNQLFRHVLLEGEIQRLEGRTTHGDDVLIQVSPLSVTQRKQHGMMFILSDITQLKQSERNRSRALHFLSHDLRSPITSLLSLIQMQRQDSPHYDYEEMSDRIEHYAKKALRLAEDFLRLARAENADQSNFRETDLVTVVHNAVDEVYTEARKKEIQIVRRIVMDSAWTHADPSLIERALINLLENAIRYSAKGSQVEIILEIVKEELTCWIQDQGRGIASDDLQRIFEPFQRVTTSSDEEQRGTGLGLPFVRVVAEKHGGTVTVNSQPGEGSLFCFKIPYELLIE